MKVKTGKTENCLEIDYNKKYPLTIEITKHTGDVRPR